MVNKYSIPKIKYIVLFVMLLSFMTNMAVANNLTYKQLNEEKVTIKATKVKLEHILNEIHSQTKISFIFDSEDIKSSFPDLNIDVKAESISVVLNKLLQNTPYKYSINNGIVIIKKNKIIQANNKEDKSRFVVVGKVIDKNTKQPQPGATVIVVGKTTGAITDEKGMFRFMVDKEDVLEISFIGKKTVNKNKLSDKNLILIELEDDIIGVNDVVVTGYGRINRADMVGSATTLKADDIKITGKTNIAEMLQGQVAGMIVTNTSARAGATPNIQIRGQSTLSAELGNRNPLWVVDGVIQDDPINLSKEMVGADDIKNLIGNQVSWLNPEDIENITVLKDASATAIYGSRASNGVIVITTKKPKSDKLTLTYSGSSTIKGRPNYSQFNYMNSKERIEITEELYNAGLVYEKTPIKQMNTFDGVLRSYIERDITLDQYERRRAELETMNTDWFDVLTRTSISQSHNISLSSRMSDRLGISASVGYSDNKGQEIKNNSSTGTGRISLNAKINDRLRVNFSINASKNSNEGTVVAPSSAGGGHTPLNYAIKTSRSIPDYNPDGTLSYYKVYSNYTYNQDALLSYNFLNEVNNSSAESKSVMLNANINATLDITDWLSYEVLVNYSYNSGSRDIFANDRTFFIANKYRGYDYNSVLPTSLEYGAALMPHGGEFTMNETKTNSYNIQNKILLSKTLNDVHRFNAMFANEVRSIKSESLGTHMWGYMPDRGNKFSQPPLSIKPITGTYEGVDYGLLSQLFAGKNYVGSKKDNFVSLFATFAYSFDNRYVFNFNIRNDMSNRFGQNTNNRFDPTYSFGVKWNLTNEKFLENRLKFLTYLSLSATYGIQGNALLSESSDLLMSINGIDAYYKEPSSSIRSIPNPFLSWEKTSNWNFALTGRLFDIFNVNFEYYRRESNAMVLEEIGFENGVNQMKVNGGVIHNSGVEGSISFNPVNNKNFGLIISLNSSKNWNKGGNSSLSETAKSKIDTYLKSNSSQIVKEGYPLGAIWAYSFSHLDDENGSARFKYMDTDPLVAKNDPTTVLEYVGQTDPYFTGGLSLGFRYKNFNLSSSLSMILGSVKRLPSPYSTLAGGSNRMPESHINLSRDLIKRWKKTGDEQITFYPGLTAGAEDRITVPGQTGSLSSINMWENSNIMIVDGGFLRCNNVMLTYNFNNKWVKENLGLARLAVSGSISNLFVIGSKRFNGFDPELGDSVMPRAYSLSLNVSF